MTGPFETERQARDVPAVQAVYDAFGRDPGPGKMAPHCHRILEEACEAAGVKIGAYDHRILVWLAGWGPETCAVVAGLISRANLAGVVFTAGQETIVAQALADAEKYRRRRVEDWCGDCAATPAGACDDHLDDLDLADAYRDLAAELARVLPEPPREGSHA